MRSASTSHTNKSIALHTTQVVTGASGGSILAALLATKTEEELLTDVLTEDFSTDFKAGLPDLLQNEGRDANFGCLCLFPCLFVLPYTCTTHTRAHARRATGR